jgi:hypothetical protein
MRTRQIVMWTREKFSYPKELQRLRAHHVHQNHVITYLKFSLLVYNILWKRRIDSIPMRSRLVSVLFYNEII